MNARAFSHQPGRVARIDEIETTRNGYVIAQVVKTDDNGSRFILRGSDMLDGGRIGDRVFIQPFTGRAAHRIEAIAGGGT